MLTFAVDSKRDLYLDDSNSIAMLTGLEALAATCTAVMSTLTTEMLFDTTKGVDYQNNISPFGVAGIPAFIRSGTRALMGIKGIKKVLMFRVSQEGRFVAIVETDLGEITVSNLPSIAEEQ